MAEDKKLTKYVEKDPDSGYLPGRLLTFFRDQTKPAGNRIPIRIECSPVQEGTLKSLDGTCEGTLETVIRHNPANLPSDALFISFESETGKGASGGAQFQVHGIKKIEVIDAETGSYYSVYERITG